MSSYSSLILCHAAPPPVVTGASLAAFLRRVAETDAVAGGADLLCQVKFGARIDQDELRAESVEWDESGLIATHGEYDWDYSECHSSLAAVAAAVSGLPGSIYRAFLDLGGLHEEVVAALTREASPDNEQPLCLCDLSFEIGPVRGSSLVDRPFFAGWMGLRFSGYGYFFPWTYKEARLRAESVGRVRGLTEACMQTWPLRPTVPSQEVVEVRRRMGELWLYDDPATPSGWLWIVAETG